VSVAFVIWHVKRMSHVTFLGAFAKLQKLIISFDMSFSASIRPPARMEQLDSHWKDIGEI
jgi:hypothetical protein